MAPIPVVKQIHLYSHLWYTCTINEQYSESLLNLDYNVYLYNNEGQFLLHICGRHWIGIWRSLCGHSLPQRRLPSTSHARGIQCCHHQPRINLKRQRKTSLTVPLTPTLRVAWQNCDWGCLENWKEKFCFMNVFIQEVWCRVYDCWWILRINKAFTHPVETHYTGLPGGQETECWDRGTGRDSESRGRQSYPKHWSCGTHVRCNRKVWDLNGKESTI